MANLAIAQTALFIIGVGLILLGILRFKKYKDLVRWVEVPAIINRIKDSSYGEGEDGIFSDRSIKVYYPEINYSYSYKGKIFESDRVSLNLSNIGIPLANHHETGSYSQRFWKEWKKGLEIKAFVNPVNPKKAVLINKMSQNFKSTNILLVIAGIFIVAVSLFVF